jgi:hypothetical protein
MFNKPTSDVLVNEVLKLHYCVYGEAVCLNLQKCSQQATLFFPQLQLKVHLHIRFLGQISH